MKSRRSGSNPDLSGRIVRCTDDELVLIVKFKPDAGIVSRREVDLIMSILDEVLQEVDLRCALEAAEHPALEKSSPCKLQEELSVARPLQTKRRTS